MDNNRKEIYLFVLIIILTLVIGIFIGDYVYKNPIHQSVNQNVNINSSEKAEKINLNTASEKILSSLPGIGEVKAKKIIEYREKNGDFESIYEIMNVEGIGDDVVSKIVDRVVIK